MKTFENEEIFLQLTIKRKKMFLYAIQQAALKAAEDEEPIIAQGLSCFGIWCLALAMKRPEDKQNIEARLSKLHNEYHQDK